MLEEYLRGLLLLLTSIVHETDQSIDTRVFFLLVAAHRNRSDARLVARMVILLLVEVERIVLLIH